MKIVGNPEVWLRLGRERPCVALLSGPDGVGRATNAALIAGAFTPDSRRFDSLLVKDADEILSYLTLAPRKLKIVVLNPEKASSAAWSRLLTVLESPPPNCLVWIIDNGAVPPAIQNRCATYEFGFLTADELRRIMPTPEDEEIQLFDWEAGSYRIATEGQQSMSGLSNVVAWIRAIENSSREELLRCVRGWQGYHTRLLRQELDEQYLRQSKLTYPWTKDRTDYILSAFDLLECDDARLGATTAGLFLLERS